MQSWTSFTSEHTVEYAVVDAVRSIFECGSTPVVPLFFWKTREGGKIARAIHGRQVGTVFAVFPRRPRPYGTHLDQVGWKINGELHAHSQAASNFGIQTFAALPVARSLLELASHPPIHWIRVLPGGTGDDEYISAAQGAEVDSGPTALLEAAASSPLMDWKSMVEAMGSLRSSTVRYPLYFGVGGYRPIYFLALRA